MVALSNEISATSFLQPGFLPRRFLEALGLITPHSAVFLTPAVIDPYSDPLPWVGFTRRGTLANQYLGFTQSVDDMLSFEWLSDHWVPSQYVIGLILTSAPFLGAGHTSGPKWSQGA